MAVVGGNYPAHKRKEPSYAKTSDSQEPQRGNREGSHPARLAADDGPEAISSWGTGGD